MPGPDNSIRKETYVDPKDSSKGVDTEKDLPPKKNWITNQKPQHMLIDTVSREVVSFCGQPEQYDDFLKSIKDARMYVSGSGNPVLIVRVVALVKQKTELPTEVIVIVDNEKDDSEKGKIVAEGVRTPESLGNGFKSQEVPSD